MTRQERLTAIAEDAGSALIFGRAVASMIETDDTDADKRQQYANDAAHYGRIGLDHLAALEADAVTTYLADVPLPEGWTEECVPASPSLPVGACHYYDEDGYVRVRVGRTGFYVASTPAHWPAIPQAVLVRAAVQCSRLREQGR